MLRNLTLNQLIEEMLEMARRSICPLVFYLGKVIGASTVLKRQVAGELTDGVARLLHVRK